jgi:hypothetical protein
LLFFLISLYLFSSALFHNHIIFVLVIQVK